MTPSGSRLRKSLKTNELWMLQILPHSNSVRKSLIIRHLGVYSLAASGDMGYLFVKKKITA